MLRVNFRLNSEETPYIGKEIALTLMLRGQTPSLFAAETMNFGAKSDLGGDLSVSAGYGYYLNVNEMSSDMIEGTQVDASVGINAKFIAGGGLSAGPSFGLNDYGKISNITFKSSLSVGLGISSPIVFSGGGGVTGSYPYNSILIK